MHRYYSLELTIVILSIIGLLIYYIVQCSKKKEEGYYEYVYPMDHTRYASEQSGYTAE